MMNFNLRPFDETHIADAGALLAARHRRDRIAQPLLPARFERPEEAEKAVAATWKRSDTAGYAAFDRGRMIGYLFGERIVDAQRGRHVWLRLPGHALADGVEAEFYRDLYAAAGSRWLEQGCFDHYAMIPAADRGAQEAFFALSFGKEQAHAVCDLDRLVVPQADGAGDSALRTSGAARWVIREATKDDRAKLAEAAEWIPRHLTGAPVWSAMLPERLNDRRESYATIVDDEAGIPWLAEENGELLGVAFFFRADPAEDDLLVGDDCAILAVGATRPEARGRGVATALTWHGMADVKARGFRTCQIDWRATNLEASRFWPRFGFDALVYRLVRRVDSRVVWAR
jgi:GNAT superfamily N-acetyltransferase